MQHLLPQAVPSIIVASTLGVAGGILTEAAMSYLGLGIAPPNASWGNLLMNALTDDDLRELRARATPAVVRPDGDYSEMFGPDLGLHDFIHRKCPLGYLNALLDSVQLHRTRLLELEHSAGPGYRRASMEEHLEIVQALEQRDAKAARRLMQEHLDRVGAEIEAIAVRRIQEGAQ